MAALARPAAKSEVLVVEDEEHIRQLVAFALTRAGYEVTTAANGEEALERVAEAIPDLVVSDVMMPGLDGLGLLARLREDPTTRGVPVILLTAKGGTDHIVEGLGLGADDYLPKPFKIPELVARARAKLDRPPVPGDELPRDRQTGLLSEAAFAAELAREIARSARGGASGSLALLCLDELPRLKRRLGPRSEAEIARQVAALVLPGARPLDLVARDRDGRFMLLMPETAPEAAERWLGLLVRRLADHRFTAGRERVRLTPAIGLAPLDAGLAPRAALDRALAALEAAQSRLDLRPVRYRPEMDPGAAHRRARAAQARRRWAEVREAFRLPAEIVLTQVAALGLPLAAYIALARRGVDPTGTLYVLTVAGLAITAYFILVECLLAVRPAQPPGDAPASYPPASAIVAAYLPNEAATIVETVEAVLRVEYPGALQVILAYNTPRDLPVEAALRELARRDPRFLPLRVEGSTSKAQNVNRALAEVTGEFVGIFDADAHPSPDAFTRAWRWLAAGYDVVQGHAVVRNGDESWVARMVAVEFEAIYAVSHPGRARLHGFGIFGGSNGYWKADVLRRTRLRQTMLTEDIDSSIRLVAEGYKIASDPFLVARELAPVTVRSLWHQRMRWAQGWFQVSLRHVWRGLASRHTSMRQKLGLVHLLVWRELYSWLSLQMFPIIAYWAWARGGLHRVDWLVPLFVLTSAFTLSTGPLQVLFAYLLAAPEIRRRRGWFWFHLLMALLFYVQLKNMIGRVAQVNELFRDRAWRVTPRGAAGAPDAGRRAA